MPVSELEEMTITPELARRWLDNGAKNVPLRNVIVADYARQIQEEKWEFNGESIKFDVNDQLIDGQHRLQAVIRADKPIRSVVVRGLPPTSFQTIDRGRKRTTGDTFALLGIGNANHIASSLNILWRYEQGIWHRGGYPHPTTAELVELLGRHPSLPSFIPAGRRCLKLLRPSLTTTLAYLFSQRDETLAETFFDGLAEGTDLHIEEPVRLLRERLFTNRASKSRLQQREVLALVIKAWNLTRAGARSRNLRWRAAGDSPEPFPSIE